MLFRNDDKKDHSKVKHTNSISNTRDKTSFTKNNDWNLDAERALLIKTYEDTAIVGFLSYKGEIKGIRFFDGRRNQFLDIAPWHLDRFAISKLKLQGIRHLELFRHENRGDSNTLLIQYLTKHELENRYRPIRMVSKEVVEALSFIERYMSDEDYVALLTNY